MASSYLEALVGIRSGRGRASSVPERQLSDCIPRDQADIPSTWCQATTTSTHKGTSTDAIGRADAQVQARESASISTQAQGASIRAATNSEAAALAAFLARVVPMALAEQAANLEQNPVSTSQHSAASRQEPAECSYTLRAFADGSYGTSTRINKHKLVVTSISWNATGQTIAAAFGRYDIVGWCSYPGALATWNLARGGLDANRPDRFSHVDNCVMCCAFHPTEPCLIAGGTFNGEVVVWDLSRDGDAQAAKSDTLSDARHREPISAVTWLYSGSDMRRHGSQALAYRLASLGRDGRLLVWLWNKMDNPVYGYELAYSAAGFGLGMQLGGTCIAFPKRLHQEETGGCMIGTEGGLLLKCQLDMNEVHMQAFSKAMAAADGSRVDMHSPVRDGLHDLHTSAVNGLDASPFQRELLLSCGADGQLHLLSWLKHQPLLTLQPTASYLSAVQWSPSRPLVFATAAGDGGVYIYDLAISQEVISPVMRLEANSSGSSPAHALAFNSSASRIFASAASDEVKVWRLSAALSDPHKGEERLLKRVADSDDVGSCLK